MIQRKNISTQRIKYKTSNITLLYWYIVAFNVKRYTKFFYSLHVYMKFIKNIFKWWSDWFKSIKSDNKKQLLELEKIEQMIDEQKKEQKEEQKKIQAPIVITNRMFLKFWVIGILVVLLGFFVYQSLSIIYLICIAFILSIVMEAIIWLFYKRIHHRWISIALAYVLFVLAAIGALIFIVPFLLSQLSEVIMVFIAKFVDFQKILTTKSLISIVQETHWLPATIKSWLLDSLGSPEVVAWVQSQLQQNISHMINMWTAYAKSIGNMAVSAVGSLISFITQTSIVIVLSVMLSIQKEAVMKFISRFGWEKKYKTIYMKLEKIYKKLGVRLKSELLLCIFIGSAMYIALWILALFGLDLPHKWSIAIVAGLVEFIPYLGPWIGGFVAALVAFVNFGRYGILIIIGVVVLLQRLENNVLIPVLMNKTLGINPVVVFISIILWAILWWVIWVLLAVPIAVIITLVMEKTFEE